MYHSLLMRSLCVMLSVTLYALSLFSLSPLSLLIPPSHARVHTHSLFRIVQFFTGGHMCGLLFLCERSKGGRLQSVCVHLPVGHAKRARMDKVIVVFFLAIGCYAAEWRGTRECHFVFPT